MVYKSKDLLADLEIKHAEQVFVSDITYIKLASQHAYLALVTDVSKKKLWDTKLTQYARQTCQDALEMAVKTDVTK
jgi:transposase InsO family protein